MWIHEHWRDLVWAALCAAAALLLANLAHAIQTNEVEIGEGAHYDGQVRIQRDATGQMIFRDSAITSPVTLTELNTLISDHSALTGLSGDDHPLYLNEARHSTIHSTDFNSSMTLPADAGGNTRLGDHVTDHSIHLPRDEAIEISGPWRFTATPQFWNNLHLSNGGSSGDAALTFEDGDSDAQMLWDESADRFVLNRGLEVESGDLRLGGALYGVVGTQHDTAEYLHLTMDDDAATADVVDLHGRFTFALSDASGTPQTQAHSVPGVIGKALSFDGIDDHIALKHDLSRELLGENKDFTLAFW